jgi:thiamine-monophosphate kinase
VSADRRPPGRDRIRPGDVLFASGKLGGSRAARHLRIEPRVALGRWLHERGVQALMDVSDGLALDLWRMARASGLRAELEHVPVHRDARAASRRDGRSAVWHALHDGEDHELLGAISAPGWEQLSRTKRGRELERLGSARRGSGLRLAPGLLSPEGGAWTPGEGSYLHGS